MLSLQKQSFLQIVSNLLFALYIAIGIMSLVSIQIFTIADHYLIELPLIGALLIMRLVYPLSLARALDAIKSKKIIYTLAIISVDGFIGLIRTGDMGAVYPECRSLMLLIGSIAIISSWLKRSDRMLLVLLYSCFMASIEDLILTYHIRGEIAEGKTILIVGLPLGAMALSVILKGELLTVLASAIALATGFISGYRAYIILACLASLICFILLLQRRINEGSIYRGIVTIVLYILLGFGALIILSPLISLILGSEMGTIHLVNKTNNLLDVLGGYGQLDPSDQQRLYYYERIVDNPWMYWLPHGIGSRAMVEEMAREYNFGSIGGAATMDSGWLFFLYHFGVILMILTLGIWVRPFVNAIKKIKPFGLLLLFGLFLTLGVYLAFTSDLFVVVPVGMATAIWVTSIAAGIFLMNKRKTIPPQRRVLNSSVK